MKVKIISMFVLMLLLSVALPATTMVAGKFYISTDSNCLNLDKREEIKLSEIGNKIEKIMRYSHFPSISACLVKDDRVVWSNGYGYTDIENGYSANEKTIYSIASTTKTITGTALMQLYERELFDLDDDINNYLPFNLMNPNFPDIPITFRMILSHSSSLQEILEYWNVDLFNYNGPPFEGYPMPWLEEFLVPGGETYNSFIWDDEFPPGERFQYANINYDLVAFLVELISDKPFYEYCQLNIFNPLDMKNTSFHITDFNDEQIAIPHTWNFNTKNLDRNRHFVNLHYPVGGIFTNVLDLSHLLIVHMNGGVFNGTRILKESTVDEMHRIQSAPGGLSYGLAWHLEGRSIWVLGESMFRSPFFYIFYFPNHIYEGHGGAATNGVTSCMFMKSNEDTGIIFFINNDARFYKKGHNGYQVLREILFNYLNT